MEAFGSLRNKVHAYVNLAEGTRCVHKSAESTRQQVLLGQSWVLRGGPRLRLGGWFRAVNPWNIYNHRVWSPYPSYPLYTLDVSAYEGPSHESNGDMYTAEGREGVRLHI